MKPSWSLLSILLLMAAVAAWTTYLRMHFETPKLMTKAKLMAEFSGELFVKDDSQLASIKLPQDWDDDHRWDVMLPAGDYALRLATRFIAPDRMDGYPKDYEEYLLPRQSAGRHRLELIRKEDYSDNSGYVIIQLDGDEIIRIDEKDWRPINQDEPKTHAESGTSIVKPVTYQQPANKPLTLYRTLFSVPSKTPGSWVTPDVPSSGILFWIEQVDGNMPDKSGE